MTWTRHSEPQQRGAQLHNQGAPAEAVKDRAAQQHDMAVPPTQPGEAPGSRLEDQPGDNTPTLGDPHVEWDEVVQPERMSDEEPPEGK